jgi:uncharacterized Tic20 family protein
MNRNITIKLNTADRKTAAVLASSVLFFTALAMLQDIIHSGIQHAAFYFSESLLFSSFWWLFAPLLFAQYVAVKYKKDKTGLAFQVALVALPVVIHLLAFPLLVWLLSGTFYYHTYSFKQTFSYTLSAHLYLLVLFYLIPAGAFRFFTKKAKAAKAVAAAQEEPVTRQFASTLIIAEAGRKFSIPVSEILYFSAAPPYVIIHLNGKKHLCHGTLRSMLDKTDPGQFVRVHKSTIVNINMVVLYTSRLNGDYDVTMKNNVQLRVSRNFAAAFKNLFSKTHRLTAK